MGEKTELSYKLDNIILEPSGYSILYRLWSWHVKLFRGGVRT